MRPIEANIRITAVDDRGEVLGQFEGVLQSGERMSRLVTELIPGVGNQNGGFILVRSDVPLHLTSLFGTKDGRVLANIAPQPVPREFEPTS